MSDVIEALKAQHAAEVDGMRQAFSLAQMQAQHARVDERMRADKHAEDLMRIVLATVQPQAAPSLPSVLIREALSLFTEHLGRMRDDTDPGDEVRSDNAADAPDADDRETDEELETLTAWAAREGVRYRRGGTWSVEVWQAPKAAEHAWFARVVTFDPARTARVCRAVDRVSGLHRWADRDDLERVLDGVLVGLGYRLEE